MKQDIFDICAYTIQLYLNIWRSKISRETILLQWHADIVPMSFNFKNDLICRHCQALLFHFILFCFREGVENVRTYSHQYIYI